MRSFNKFPCYILLLIIVSLPVVITAQTTTVMGKVFDAKTGEPLPYVNITFKNSKIGTTTDTAGNFRIETYYPTDSLIASFMGYRPQLKKVEKDKKQVIDFAMKSSEVKLEEFVVKYKGNPAHTILDRVIENKAANNKEKFEAYEYEVYNKVEFDLNNITEDFKERKLFKEFEFIFDNIDTLRGKTYLPMFMTESVSDYYYRKNPKSEKEIIKATKVSGVSNESVSQFLGDMYQKVNIYDNYISVFGKTFVSPISDFGLRFYKYYLMDSTYIDNLKCYKLRFMPKHKQEPVFTGDMWINDTTYAVKKIEASIAANANINFINGFEVFQEYKKVEGEYWMLKKDKLVVDFQVGEKIMGFFGKKTTSYNEFKINEPRSDEFYSGPEKVVVNEDANKKSKEYWENERHDSLSRDEKNIYNMVDTLKKIPRFNTYIDIISMFISGYKEWGNFEIGPYATLYSYNPVEGHRFKLGGRTSNQFSTKIEFSGYLAYGLKDQRFKYGGGMRGYVSKSPRQIFGLYYKNDVEQLGQSQNAFQEDNLLSSFLRRNPNNKLTNVEEYRGYYEYEWFEGFSNKLMLKKREMTPLGSLEYRKEIFENGNRETVNIDALNTSEISFYTRFAYDEKYVAGEFDRISLGTKYPTIEAQYSRGLKGVLESEYNYDRLEVGISDKVRLGTFGYTNIRLSGGKIWGNLPYPLLELHNGNETYFFDKMAFNLMNFFEFASDEWVSVMATHHFDGYFLNKIPLLRKLKWREVATGKAVIGRLNPKHNETLIIPDNMYELKRPYVEVAAGIENIFKIIRIDALWRLTYLDHPDISEFGVRGTFEINF